MKVFYHMDIEKSIEKSKTKPVFFPYLIQYFFDFSIYFTNPPWSFPPLFGIMRPVKKIETENHMTLQSFLIMSMMILLCTLQPLVRSLHIWDAVARLPPYEPKIAAFCS